MLTVFRAAADPDSLVPDDGALAVPADASSMCRLATGRSALFHLISRLPAENRDFVLLPAYVAEGVIEPFVRAGFAVLFYRLGPDLSPRTEDVAALLERTGGKAVFVLIHYFGFSARSADLSSVLSAGGALVVEDFAHALFTTSPNGTPLAADAAVSLFSLNKFLPLADGALLFSRIKDIDVSLEDSSLPELPAETLQAYNRHLHTAHRLLACGDPAAVKGLLAEIGDSYECYYRHIRADLGPKRQSDEARRIARLLPCGSLVHRRVVNSRLLYRDLNARLLRPLHPVLPEGVVPFCVPALVPAGERGRIIEHMLGRGVVLSTLRDKWDFIPEKDATRFAVERAFIEQHILIPVNETISPDSMAHMVEQLNGM